MLGLKSFILNLLYCWRHMSYNCKPEVASNNFLITFDNFLRNLIEKFIPLKNKVPNYSCYCNNNICFCFVILFCK